MSVSNYFYQGDYEDLLDWIVKAYPPKAYSREGFNAWLKDVRNNFLKDGKHFSDTIAEEMKTFWLDNDLGKLGIPDKDDRPINRARTFNSIREQGTFTTTDAYEFNQERERTTGKNWQAVIRRELQELVKEGKLERIRKGVYQTK